MSVGSSTSSSGAHGSIKYLQQLAKAECQSLYEVQPVGEEYYKAGPGNLTPFGLDEEG